MRAACEVFRGVAAAGGVKKCSAHAAGKDSKCARGGVEMRARATARRTCGAFAMESAGVRRSTVAGASATGGDRRGGDSVGYVNFESRDAVREAAQLAVELDMTIPTNETYQQTVRRSITFAGIGLKSGEVELVRVRPARAGEGRYFVQVPKGTLDASATERSKDVEYTEEEEEDLLLEKVRMALSNDEEEKAKARELAAKDRAAANAQIETPESYDSGEVRVHASYENVVEDVRLRSELKGGFTVLGAEHLLSALEAMGIDNCRIELEGSGEVPIMDGSASTYAYDFSCVGLAPSLSADGAQAPRMAWKIKENVMVQEGDAFMMLNVDDACKLTYGIDFSYKSTAIGKQWESWTPVEDAPYVFHISPARTFGTINDFTAYYRAGHIRAGLEECVLVANGEEYWNAPLRVSNEPARHKILDLIGDLSLLAEPGMSGVPVGHVVAYKASHKLHAKFIKALAAAAKEQVPAELWNQ